MLTNLLQSFGLVDSLLSTLESFPITIPLMQESAIGKTVRQLSKAQIASTKYNLAERFSKLFDKWNGTTKLGKLNMVI